MLNNPRNLLWRWYMPHLGITLLTLTLAALYSFRAIEKLHTARWVTDLETQAYLAGQWLGASEGAWMPTARIQARCLQLGAETGQRWTLVDAEGRVLGDSDGDLQAMARDRHATRPEIMSAFRNGSGWARRHSATIAQNLLYVARRIDSVHPENGPVTLGVIRVSVPMTQVEAGLRAARLRMRLAFAGVLLLALWAGFWVSRRTTAPVAALNRGLRKVAGGELSYRVPDTGGHGTVDGLSENLNRLAQRMQDQIEALAVERAYREAILASMTEGVLALDLGQRISWLNEAAAVMLQVRAARLIGSAVHEVVPHAGFLQAVDAATATTTPQECEATIGHRPQTVLWIHASALYNGARARVGTVFVINDLTHMRHLERVRKDFVANVSHELKTPVTALRGVLETLLDGSTHDAATTRRFLEIAGRQSTRLDRIVNDLLLLSRIESQTNGSLERESLNLRNLLRGSIESCGRRATERRVTIDLSGPQDLVLPAHASLLEQALANLMDNAIKYGPEDATVSVTVERIDREIRISVRDQGPGIARQHRDRIFERFYRIDRGRSRDLGGTGLGLSIVRHIVELHDGRIELESEPGAGSTFRVYLPVECVPPPIN